MPVREPFTPVVQGIVEKHVVCPRCGGDGLYAPSNPSRPFCSPRCRNIDLGAWSAEEFRLPAAPPVGDDEHQDWTPDA